MKLLRVTAMAAVLWHCTWTLFAHGSLETLLSNGPSSRMLNIVVLAEGFTATQETKFRENALNVLDQFLSTPPYSDYRGYFNAFGVFVESNEAGSDHPSRGISRDTYFHSTYDSHGLQRLITIPGTGQQRVNELLQEHLPEYDIVLLLVNDDEYGGSGGFPAVASINSSAAEIAIHEIGHSFAGLGDEYDTPFSYPEIEEPNTTRETRREHIKWRDWILSDTPIPTPESPQFGSVVGLFEGAHYQPTGWYRPKLDCKMNSLNQPFCEVCSEAIVISCYVRLDMIHSHSPQSPTLSISTDGEALFEAETASPSNHGLSFEWTVDGTRIPGDKSPSFRLSGRDFSPGIHSVNLSVRDATPLVRNDPLARLVETRHWSVDVVEAAGQPPTVGPFADLTIREDEASEAVSFTISDPDTDPSVLILSAESSNPEVIPAANLKFEGTDGLRTLTITPAPDANGEAVITVRASDGVLTGSSVFRVTVLPVNDAPIVAALPDQIIFAGEPPLAITFAVSDVDTPAGSLVLSAISDNQALLPDSNLSLQWAWGGWSLSAIPQPGILGVARISVIANDGTAEMASSFDFVVNPVPVVRAESIEIAGDMLHLRFTSSAPADLTLETSTDFKEWIPIHTDSSATLLEHSVLMNGSGFFRITATAPRPK